jgi:hypothetical protein
MFACGFWFPLASANSVSPKICLYKKSFFQITLHQPLNVGLIGEDPKLGSPESILKGMGAGTGRKKCMLELICSGSYRLK